MQPSTLTEYRHTADRIARELGDVAIEDVTPEMLERWKAKLSRSLSNRSVAKYLVILHGIFKRAMKVWGLPRNPVVDAFSPEEVWALVRAAGSPQDAALFLTAAFTGLRMGELLALQWRDVDFAGEAVRVRRSYNAHGGLGTPKSGKVRSVPMVSGVAAALARLAERERFVREEDLVFPGPFGLFQDASSLRVRYRAALARAGLRALRFHDPRHTFGTLAVRRAGGAGLDGPRRHQDHDALRPPP